MLVRTRLSWLPCLVLSATLLACGGEASPEADNVSSGSGSASTSTGSDASSESQDVAQNDDTSPRPDLDSATIDDAMSSPESDVPEAGPEDTARPADDTSSPGEGDSTEFVNDVPEVPSDDDAEPASDDAVEPPPEDTSEPGDEGADTATADVAEPPPVADMDGDGIPDESDDDIDGDGYSNADETHAGSDPMDADSVIYQGGWPYNADKDELADPGWDSEPALGTVMPNYQAPDQYGDLVSLYDFAHTGKPVVLDVVTWFCEPCKAMADYFSNGDASVMDEFLFFQDKYDIIRDLIVNGDIHWVTIIWSGGAPVTQEDAALWEETWPSGFVTVLADTELQLQEYLYVKAMPRIDILDESMTFVAFCDNDVPCDSELEGGGPGGPGAGLKWLKDYHDALYGEGTP